MFDLLIKDSNKSVCYIICCPQVACLVQYGLLKFQVGFYERIGSIQISYSSCLDLSGKYLPGEKYLIANISIMMMLKKSEREVRPIEIKRKGPLVLMSEISLFSPQKLLVEWIMSRKLATINDVIVNSQRLIVLDLYLLLLKFVTRKINETERRIILPQMALIFQFLAKQSIKVAKQRFQRGIQFLQMKGMLKLMILKQKLILVTSVQQLQLISSSHSSKDSQLTSWQARSIEYIPNLVYFKEGKIKQNCQLDYRYSFGNIRLYFTFTSLQYWSSTLIFRFEQIQWQGKNLLSSQHSQSNIPEMKWLVHLA